MKNKLYNTVIKATSKEQGKKIIEWFKSKGAIDDLDLNGESVGFYYGFVFDEWGCFELSDLKQGTKIIELPEEQPIPSTHPFIDPETGYFPTMKDTVATYDFTNPDHYKKFSVETIDMMVAIWGKEATAIHCEMCAFKYRLRMGEKPDQPIEQDLKKVNWYLNKVKELRE